MKIQYTEHVTDEEVSKRVKSREVNTAVIHCVTHVSDANKISENSMISHYQSYIVQSE